MKIGQSIKDIRKKRGISQGTLAQKLNISQSYLSLVESEIKLPSLELVKVISDTLLVPVPLLFMMSIDESDFSTENKSQAKISYDIARGLLDILSSEQGSMSNPIAFHPIVSIVDFRKVCKASQNTINDILKNIGKYYYIKTEPKLDANKQQKVDAKGNKLYRTLTPSIKQLKMIQKNLNNYLQTIPLPHNSHGSAKGKDYITNAAAHAGSNNFFCTDLKDFFPSITNKKVNDALLKIGHTPHIARLIAKLTTYANNVPQGAPTSPIISNIVMLEVDNILIEYCNTHNLIYTRYVDDVTISSPSPISQEHIDFVIQTLVRPGYKLSRKKTYLTKGKAEITGVVVRKGGLSAPKKQYNKLMEKDRSETSKKGVRQSIERIKKSNKQIG